MSRRNADLRDGFDAGSYANAYETEDLDEALDARPPARARRQAYRRAFILGFFSTYELDEIPEEYRDEHAEAYWSRDGRSIIRRGYMDSREE